MEGGAESGFNYAKPDEYKPRLFHVSGNTAKNIVIREVRTSGRGVESDWSWFGVGLVVLWSRAGSGVESGWSWCGVGLVVVWSRVDRGVESG